MNRFFILGSQRSGTTLLRLIMNSHPLVHCYGEVKGYTALENQSFGETEGFQSAGFQLPLWTELFAEYDCVKNHRQKSPVIFMTRNALSVVASMKKMPEFIDLEVKDKIDTWMNDKGRSFAERFGEDVVRAKGHPCEDVILSAIFWRYKTETFDRLEEPKLLVGYKDLVTNPKKTIKKVVKFLGLPWSNQLMMHYIFEHDEVVDGIAMGGTTVARPVDKISLTKWKRVLTNDEIEEIRKIQDKVGKHLLEPE